MTAQFSLGMFSKLKVSNGYLVIGKEGKTVRLSDIKSLNITKEGVVITGAKAQLAVIKGLKGQKAFAAIDFINIERDKIKPAKKSGSFVKGPTKFLLILVVVIILAIAILAAYSFLQTP